MIGKAKEGWQHYQRFKRFEPGHRFQTRYHRRRRRTEQGQTSKYGRTFNLVGGLVLIVAGFVFLPTPGPSYIIIVLGLWMLAGEFLVLARFFDRAEVSLRKLSSTSSFSERRVSRTHPARVMRLSPFSVLLP
jgi:hypothetical protein